MCNFDSLLMVGTYTCNSDSEGIYVYMVDSETMEMELNYIAREAADPSSFVYLPERNLLVVANEDQQAPHFSTFYVDTKMGKLDFISKIDLPGAGTCHVSVSPDGKWVVGANYHSGSLVWAKMEENGEFTGLVQTIWYHDASVNKERQTRSYLHGTAFIGNKLHAMNLDGRYVMICNQFSNTLTICKFNRETNEVGEVLMSLEIPGCSYLQMIKRD